MRVSSETTRWIAAVESRARRESPPPSTCESWAQARFRRRCGARDAPRGRARAQIHDAPAPRPRATPTRPSGRGRFPPRRPRDPPPGDPRGRRTVVVVVVVVGVDIASHPRVPRRRPPVPLHSRPRRPRPPPPHPRRHPPRHFPRFLGPLLPRGPHLRVPRGCVDDVLRLRPAPRGRLRPRSDPRARVSARRRTRDVSYFPRVRLPPPGREPSRTPTTPASASRTRSS